MHQISIIIPTLNEETYIGKLLEYLLANSSKKNISEIIVVDGGSADETQNIVNAFTEICNTNKIEAYHYIDHQILDTKSIEKQILTAPPPIKLIKSKKGRAKQMNLGAKQATGNILYFLHADSFPPKYFDQLIIDEVNQGNLAGCFKMRFNSNNWWLKLASWFTQCNWKSCRGGDQSQFITQSLFSEIGGFNEAFVIYEDNDLISKLYAKNQFVVIQKWLTTSARCYNTNGVLKLQYHYGMIHVKKWLGASPQKLNNYYKKHVTVKN